MWGQRIYPHTYPHTWNPDKQGVSGGKWGCEGKKRKKVFFHSSFFIQSDHLLANYRLPCSIRPLFATMESVFFEGNDADEATKGGRTGKRAGKARLRENERNWPFFVKNILPALGIPFVTLPTSKDYRNRNCREAVFLWLSFFISRTWGAGDDYPKDS